MNQSNVVKLIQPKQENPLFEEIEPSSEPVSVKVLLDEVEQLVRSHVSCEPETVTAATLWILSTWCLNVTEYAPIACITAPEKRCGKSTMLDLFELLVKRPFKVDNSSASALFRLVEKYQPTLLLDEIDTYISKNDEIIGVINSGYKPNGKVVRCVGKDHEPTPFKTFSCKAVAGIGEPPPTIADRGIILRLTRKMVGEKLLRLISSNQNHWHYYKRRFARFEFDFCDMADTYFKAVGEMPEHMNSRQADCWHILFAIAKAGGYAWFAKANIAAEIICGVEQGDSVGVELLTDIATVTHHNQRIKFSVKELQEWLVMDEYLQWSSHLRGSQITIRWLAKKLSSFEIKAKTVNLAKDGNQKGYHINQFDDAFERYISSAKMMQILAPEVEVSDDY